jgi:16S rRNA (cytosine1402-N4)-methyltransferase
MNISVSSLEKKHFPVMLKEVIQICNNPKKDQLVIDCTFGGGGYSKELLKLPNIKVIALDRDKSAIKRADSLKIKSSNQFKFYNEKFSNLDKIISVENKPDTIIFDLGLSTFQLQDYSRGFSFNATDKIDMQMGLSDVSAEELINTFDEKNLKLIIKILGE